MRVLIDADACPVKNIIISECKKYEIPVIMYFDNAHEYEDNYSKVVIVDRGKDSVDLKLVNETKLDDIVVSSDYGLLAMALSKKAKCITFNGKIVNDNNIHSLLQSRFISQKLRKMNKHQKGPKKRTHKNNSEFKKGFINLIKNNIE